MTNTSGFDWVAARSACSPSTVFEKIRLEVEQDVAARNQQLTGVRGSLKFLTNGNSFSVAVDSPGVSGQAVRFRCSAPSIEVCSADGKLLLQATVTLSDDGECRLRVGDEQLDSWQFRKRALEALFFDQPWMA